MRNPLKRLARRDHPRMPLRERLDAAKARLAAVKDKAERMIAVNRVMLKAPDMRSAPAVDRAALVNYATFLALERKHVCAELYPHLGAKASQFLLSMNEAWGFFHAGRDSHEPRKDVPPASSRAVSILDGLGIDWRKDRDAGGVAPDLDQQRDDTGERPALPYGWPTPDAALLEALDDLQRLDAAQTAIQESGLAAREGDRVPGYFDLEAARDGALARLARERAESLSGLQAKAKALLARSVADMGGQPFEEIARSLARDLVDADECALLPRS